MIANAIWRGILWVDVQREGFRNAERLLIDQCRIGIAPVAPPAQAVRGEAMLFFMRSLDQTYPQALTGIGADNRRIGIAFVARKIGLAAHVGAKPLRRIVAAKGQWRTAIIDAH